MIRKMLKNKLNDFEESCDLFNIPITPPPLQRSYKALCLCGNRAYVHNKERSGGVCYKCREQSKISKL
jgi:hypothetical protein